MVVILHYEAMGNTTRAGNAYGAPGTLRTREGACCVTRCILPVAWYPRAHHPRKRPGV